SSKRRCAPPVPAPERTSTKRLPRPWAPSPARMRLPGSPTAATGMTDNCYENRTIGKREQTCSILHSSADAHVPIHGQCSHLVPKRPVRFNQLIERGIDATFCTSRDEC